MAVMVAENEPQNVPQGAPAPAALPPISVRPEHLAGLSPAQLNQAKDHFRRAGYDDAAIDKAFAAPPADKTRGPIYSAQGVAISNDAQAAAYQRLLDEGTLDPGLVVAEAAKQGIALKDKNGQPYQVPGADYVAPEYHLYYSHLPVGDTPPEDLAAFNAEAVSAFGNLNLTQGEAQACINAFLTAAGEYPDTMTEDELTRTVEMQIDVLSNLKDGAEIKRLAKVGNDALKAAAPDWYTSLYDAHAFMTAQAQIALASIGRRMELR